ncbi:MAG: glycosyltransferase family 4 protein [Planctomycetota bacterium]|jgi:hypothetical protein|nr:glycosyltransferase family 4 protein [Planctomycetota bacterium]
MHSGDRPSGTLLFLTQVYVPDPTSVGQHMAGAAREMVRRGYRVVCLTSARGYDDPSRVYPSREVLDGVEVRRLPFTSFGKQSLARRLLGAVSFVLQAAWHGLFTRNLSGVVFSTSPPICSLAALCVKLFRRVPILFWVMDVNPDQAVSIGWADEKALSVRLFDGLNRLALRASDRIVPLDRFMAERLDSKVPCTAKQTVLPPWPHDAHSAPSAREDNPFRSEHGLGDRFVVMYSGNAGPTSPITALLEAARAMRAEPAVEFVFIGGGIGMEEVHHAIATEELPNVRALPYQPLECLPNSLAAADLHAVTMIDAAVGINHPCKVYGAMAAARPVLFIGPTDCHVTDLLEGASFGWRVGHDDPDALLATLRHAAGLEGSELARMGEAGRHLIEERLSEALLTDRFATLVEWMCGAASSTPSVAPGDSRTSPTAESSEAGYGRGGLRRGA